MASNTRSARAAYEEIFGPGFSDSTDPSDSEETNTAPQLQPPPKWKSPATAAVPKPIPSQSARYQVNKPPAKLPFEKSKFYGAYLDGTDPEAYERYQDAQEQYSEDGALVKEEDKDLRSRRRTSASKKTPPVAVAGAMGRHSVRSSQAATKIPPSSGRQPDTAIPKSPVPPDFKTGVSAIGHRLHVRTTMQLQSAPWNTETARKRPASCTPTAPAASSPTFGAAAIGHVRHARHEAQKKTQKKAKGGAVFE
jgi:hypothetical protein